MPFSASQSGLALPPRPLNGPLAIPKAKIHSLHSHMLANQTPLLQSRQFWPYFLTQLSNVLVDNVAKNVVTLLLVFNGLAASTGLSDAMAVNLIAAFFILPFVLFSGVAGVLAESLEKSRWIAQLKYAELAISVLLCVAILSQSAMLCLACVFLLGAQSSFFGPVKYAYMPERIHPELLTKANGYVEASTFLGILVGTILGGVLVTEVQSPWLICATLLLLSMFGVWVVRQIPSDPKTLDSRAPLTRQSFAGATRKARLATGEVASVKLSVLGISGFWCIGSIVLGNLPLVAKNTLGLSGSGVSWLMAIFSIGVALGSMLAEKLSGRRLEIGLVPLASLGLLISLLALFLSADGAKPAQADMEFLSNIAAHPFGWALFFVGVSGGMYGVPLYTLIQLRAPCGKAGLVVSYNNFQNALFMVAGALFSIAVLQIPGARPQDTILLALAVTALTCAVVFVRLPEFFFRLAVLALARLWYRIDSIGHAHIPERGAAVMVGNHVSWIDAFIVSASCRRPATFVMYYKIFDLPVVGWFFKYVAKAIPIAGKGEDPEIYQAAFDRVSEALRDGKLVCIFPEGGLTKTGDIQEFKGGVFKILERDPVPLYAFGMSGLWASFFSRQVRKSNSSLKRPQWRRPLLVQFKPVSNWKDMSPSELREEVAKLRPYP